MPISRKNDRNIMIIKYSDKESAKKLEKSKKLSKS